MKDACTCNAMSSTSLMSYVRSDVYTMNTGEYPKNFQSMTHKDVLGGQILVHQNMFGGECYRRRVQRRPVNPVEMY